LLPTTQSHSSEINFNISLEDDTMQNTKATPSATSKLATLIFFAAIFITSNSLTASAQSTAYWTTAGSASATEDEANLAKPTYTNQTVAINGGPTGTYVLRYNVTAVDGLFNNAANGFMKVRVRDNGTGANVLIALRRSNIAAGGIETIATFDSESVASGSGFQTPADVPLNHAFDFTAYVYWLDVTLNRIDESGLPGFAGAIVGNSP
jgi:hypothetical protein